MRARTGFIAAILVLVPAIALIVLALRKDNRGANGADANVGKSAPASTSSTERLIRRHILETTNDPQSVEFVRWGPHDDGRVLRRLATELGGPLPSFHFCRVTFRARNDRGAVEFFDKIAVVYQGRVMLLVNDAGDGWAGTWFPDLIELGHIMADPEFWPGRPESDPPPSG